MIEDLYVTKKCRRSQSIPERRIHHVRNFDPGLLLLLFRLESRVPWGVGFVNVDFVSVSFR